MRKLHYLALILCVLSLAACKVKGTWKPEEVNYVRVADENKEENKDADKQVENTDSAMTTDDYLIDIPPTPQEEDTGSEIPQEELDEYLANPTR